MKGPELEELLYRSLDHGDQPGCNLSMCVTGANPKLILHVGPQNLADCLFICYSKSREM